MCGDKFAYDFGPGVEHFRFVQALAQPPGAARASEAGRRRTASDRIAQAPVRLTTVMSPQW